MTKIVTLNGEIMAADVVGDLPSRDDREFWSLSGSSIVVDQTAKLTAERATMVVSAYQARQALAAAGLLTAIEALVGSQSDDVQRAWQHAVEFRRNSTTIAALASSASLTDTQLDDLFRAAKLIVA
ncbi:hypothetical protein [Ruegeria sp. HKCCD6109]|uniref:hypothetical protein n=1 Tax=Ruegeria sp. HKCCD6109 TaxID=2683017 RepID=UPI0014925F8E|nr:hypothetical protein [Ruegeria sp. HKCCD6109]NOD65744.1 hypothetical protein [Ruegeria sp. HKCCD6109]